MFAHSNVSDLADFFKDLNERPEKQVYFCRINGYSDAVNDFIKKYYDFARRNGVVIEGKIPNPDEKNLSYYSEMMGMDFRLDLEFIKKSLGKWLPRMDDFQRGNVAASLHSALDLMKRNGKPESAVKNAYIKFMCWLYYKFERIANQLGGNSVPKILYEGSVSNHELVLLSILSNAGCDIVLLQYGGDSDYLKLDAKSLLSVSVDIPNAKPFPSGYSLKTVRENLQREASNERLYGAKPSISNCTNAWIERQKGFEIARESVLSRGSDKSFYYNCFYRMNGVEDKVVYADQLFRLQQDIRNAKRHLVIVNGEIPIPTPDEIASVKRGNYANHEQMLSNLSANIVYASNIELQKIMRKAFVDIVLAETQKSGSNLNRLTNKAVYLICWLKRYAENLFPNWKPPEIAGFFFLGGCKSENEAMFLRLLARLPVDVVVFCPNLNVKCVLEDNLLYEETYDESLSLAKYPEASSQVKMGTVASHAENEMMDLLYQDSGIYKNRQFSKASVICLQTMYEEIKILWDQELVYRPFFKTENGVANLPVIFTKVSGIKDGNLHEYWNSIRQLNTDDTILITKIPYIQSGAPNIQKGFASEFFKNGKLQKSKIKSHPEYPYGILREDTQDFILEKLEMFISQKLVKGIGENGTEYTVIAQVLNLPKEIVRMIQKFDFTKKNPKLLFVNTTENILSLEDSIVVAFLNLIGFDIIFFVPTGYQCVEKHFTKKLMEEHQIGGYQYDLTVPDLSSNIINKASTSLFGKLFGRGN